MLWITLLLAASIDFKQPQLTSAANGIAATYGSEDAVYYSTSPDGKTWTEPVQIATPAKLALGNHRGPRIVSAGKTLVISAVSDGELKTWRSTDAGKTWTPGPTVTDRAKAAQEGLHTMAASPKGGLFATWLDLRNIRPGQPSMELWGAYSTDSGATWSKNFAVYKSPDGSICNCCHPSAFFDAQGVLSVMWRNALAGNRDMYLARSQDGGRTFSSPTKLGAGNWQLNACPMDGGGLAQSPDGKITSVWRREKEIYLASDNGPETPVHEGKNPSIAATKSGVFVAWSSPEGIFALVPNRAEPVPLDREGGFVSLTALPNGAVIAAWERKGTIQFHTLP